MGKTAGSLADLVLVTSDNPRTEDPLAIIAAVERGLVGAEAQVVIEPDRRRAIERAIAAARPGDAVLVCGKGHETTQTIGNVAFPFDDRAVAAEILSAHRNASSP